MLTRPSACPKCGNRRLTKQAAHDTPADAKDYLCNGPEGCGRIVRVSPEGVEVRNGIAE